MFKDLGYNTVTTMYNSGVVPVLDYGSSIWGDSNKNCQADLVQNKTGEMGWLPSKYRKNPNTLHF